MNGVAGRRAGAGEFLFGAGRLARRTGTWGALGAWAALGALLVWPSGAAELMDTFATDPLTRGWRVAGDPSLFAWNAVKAGWDVTWDSSRSNSFCYRPLPTVLTKADRFQMTVVLRMADSRAGSSPGKPAEFPLALGFLNRALLTNTSAFRGAGVSSVYGVRNIVEWNFFPDAGFGDTWATTVISSNNVFAYGHNFPLALTTNDRYEITVAYDPADQTVRTSARRNGQSVGPLEPVSLAGTPDFRLDAFSITSYSDAVQVGAPIYYGSILAHGTLEELTLVLPDPPAAGLLVEKNTGGFIEVSFVARSQWIHAVERSTDFLHWTMAAPPVVGADVQVVLRDTNSPASTAFYRVRSERQ
jgi:hypothetical protein